MDADKLFEELGYTKSDNHPEEGEVEVSKWTTQDCRVIEYSQSQTIDGIYYTMYIRFHFNGQRVEIGANERRAEYRELGRQRNPILNYKEISAIMLKLEELGWMNNENK